MRLKKSLLRIAVIIIPDLDWVFKFIVKNRQMKEKTSFRDMLWAMRKGFFMETVMACGITKDNYHDYLSDRMYLKMHPVNGVYSPVVDSKLYLPYLLKDYPELVPEYYFAVVDGRLIKLDPQLPEGLSLVDLCASRKKLALKPSWGESGGGFYVMEYRDDKILLNNTPLEITGLTNFIKAHNNYIITEYIKQNKYSGNINASSVNTVRLVCCRNNNDDEFHIARSFHRFGRAGYFVDNVGSPGGSILAMIDIETGKISNTGMLRERSKPRKAITVKDHPDSGARIEGIQIPHWSFMIRKVLEILNRLSFLKYASLDIVITENSFKIIEINSLCGLITLQIQGGLFKDECMKDFFLNRVKLNT